MKSFDTKKAFGHVLQIRNALLWKHIAHSIEPFWIRLGQNG